MAPGRIDRHNKTRGDRRVRGGRGRLALALLAALGPASARASGPLPGPGEPVKTSGYTIDFFQGPVLDSVRVTSLSGAYAPIAEGVEGMHVNTAAPAVRPLYSYRSTDYDLSISFTSPGTLKNTDFDNNGVPGFVYSTFSFTTLGGLLQLGPWGLGLVVSSQRYTVGQDQQGAPDQQIDVQINKINLQGARSFFDGQLIGGLGIRGVTLSMETSTAGENPHELVSITGSAFEAGALWTPHDLPLRAALSLRPQVKGSVEDKSEAKPDTQGDLIVEGRYLPTTVVLPWEAELGFAYQLGARPLNRPWPMTKQEYLALPRQKLLFTTSFLLSGPVSNAIGVEAFLAQKVERSGARPSLTPRAGIEAEPIQGWLQVRAGGYLEPSRYEGKKSRMHGTLGVEAKLFPWSVFGLLDEDTWWRASGFVDRSSLYLSWGVSVGIWH